jgi:hypothetical protein
MPTYLLFLLGFLGGLLALNFLKNKPTQQEKETQQLNETLLKELEHLKSRVEHLETIVAEQDLDMESRMEAQRIRTRSSE